MQRPQSLEFKSVRKEKLHDSKPPPIISYESNPSETPTQRLWPVSILPTHQEHQQFINRKLSYKIDSGGRCIGAGRLISLDQQVSQLNRLSNQSQKKPPIVTAMKPYTGLPQSQSFTQNMYKSPTNSASRPPQMRDHNHTSRLIASTYMTPPPKDWITVGNIIPVKRSISMPGYRANNASNNITKTINLQCATNAHNQTTAKKKSGPFQCLKHSIKKSSGNPPIGNPPNSPAPLKSAIFTADKSLVVGNCSTQFPKENSDKVKTSRSIFKKKSTPSNTSQVSNSKPRGIKKSISLFFSSKSYRTVKSDPSNLDRSDKGNQNESLSTTILQNEREFSFKTTARLNHSYESMLHDDDKTCSMSLYTDVNRCNSYSSMEDSSSVNYSNSVCPAETIERIRTPSESSLPDTASLCSSGNHIFAYNNVNPPNFDQNSIAAASFHGNVNYRAGDNSWKTVVGNVCRSNSKDSAIANSTLSADGMISQSKRMSQISTVSRTSDITQTSEDFNDSSYSSFNDLQIYASQIYHKKNRIKSVVPKLQPIELEIHQQESPNSYDSSPFSGSSTETLRPLSCQLRRRFLSTNKDKRPIHSNTIVKKSMYSSSIEHHRPVSLRHSHSWPNCNHLSVCKPIGPSPRQACIIGQQPSCCHKSQPRPKVPVLLKVEHYPQLKFEKLNHHRINNSPLLSQYSRLYSLKSIGMQQQIGLSNVSGHLPSSIQPPLSPIKYSSRTYQYFPS